MFAIGFLVLTLGYPGPWSLLIGGIFLLASFGATYLDYRAYMRQGIFDSKGLEETVEKPLPLNVSPKSPVRNIGLELKKLADKK